MPPLSQEQALRAIAAIDKAIADNDAAAASLRVARDYLAGSEPDIATALHGPARQPDGGYISSGDAARRFGLSDDSIRRHARRHKVTIVGSGRHVRYSVRELQDLYSQK